MKSLILIFISFGPYLGVDEGITFSWLVALRVAALQLNRDTQIVWGAVSSLGRSVAQIFLACICYVVSGLGFHQSQTWSKTRTQPCDFINDAAESLRTSDRSNTDVSVSLAGLHDLPGCCSDLPDKESSAATERSCSERQLAEERQLLVSCFCRFWWWDQMIFS